MIWVGRFLTDLSATAEKLGNAMDHIFGFSKSSSDIMDRARQGKLSPTEKANGLGGYDPRNPDALILPALRTSTPGVGSSTPAFLRAAASPSSGAPFLKRGEDSARGGVTIGAVTVNVPSGDPKEVETAVEKGIKNFWQQQTSVAAGGVD
jgi:hypothetical protein